MSPLLALLRRPALVFAAGLFIASVGSALADDTVAAPSGDTTANPWAGWRHAFLWLGQPDQPLDHTCSRRVDCFSTTRSFHAAALRSSYVDDGVWAGELTLGLGHAYDWEERPRSGFGVFSLRADLTVEILPRSNDFGVAVRLSPVVMYGWAGDGGSFEVDFPGVAALFGWRDLWGEIALPAMPTHADPRLFYVQANWRNEHWAAAVGVGTFGSLAFAGDNIEKTGAFFGVWLEGQVRLWRELELKLTMALSSPAILGLGIVWAPSEGRGPALLP